MSADSAILRDSQAFPSFSVQSPGPDAPTTGSDQTARIAITDHLQDGRVDGAWWPRSRDVRKELPNLLSTLPERIGRITRVALHMSMWEPRPNRVATSARIVKVGWFTVIEQHLMTLSDAEGHRLDLLVIPPETEDVTARHALTIAGQNTDMSAEQILETSTTDQIAASLGAGNARATPVTAVG